MRLTTGTRYRATLRLGWAEGFASNDMVAGRLRDAGFVQVEVWGSGRDRMARGEWGGASTEVELPEQVVKVEELDA